MARTRPEITTPARVRFAPSPTGTLHVGGARTALFNWLIARNTGGTFVLRLEDTDRERSTPESEAEILRALTWLGLDWDEEPQRQSERVDIHVAALARLKASGAIYPAYETDEEVAALREAAHRAKAAPVVRGRRDWSGEDLARFAAEGREPVWRFAVPIPGATTWQDLVRDEVTFDHAQIEDFVVARSDGTPTYNLAAAVDDADMGITHVIRGEDHIANTPKQILIMQALGTDLPTYGHVAMILGPDKKRLSKRHGAASTEDLEADGFMPEVVRNGLALLGWSYDDKTTSFTTQELIERFSIGRVSKSPAVFDITKLRVMQGRYLRVMTDEDFAQVLAAYLDRRGFFENKPAGTRERVIETAPIVKRKLSTLADYEELAGWLFTPLQMDPEAWEKVVGENLKHSIQVIGGGLGRLETLPDWELASIKDALQDQLHLLGENARDFLEPQRIAITGQTVSTGIYESLHALGRDETIARYRHVMGLLAEQWQAAIG